MNKVIKNILNFFKKPEGQSWIAFSLIVQGIFIFSLAVGMGLLFAGTISVDAGANRNAQSGASILLTPTVSDSDGDPLTYNWACNAGTLSSATALSPTLALPSANTGTIISCTLTASNGANSANDAVSITITGNDNPTTNQNPVVEAGQNKTVFSGKTASLLGDVTDADGDPLTYNWTCSNGSLSSSTVLNPTFTAPSVSADTTITCSLTANDNKGGTGNDSVYITVSRSEQENHNPVIDAGVNRSVAPSSSVKLSPTVSDPDGDPLTYNWSCNGGNISSVNTLNPTFNASSASGTTATCTLEVSDGRGGYASDYLTITIGSIASQNQNPIVDAGSDKNIQPGASVRLTPTVSDPDGDVLTYRWSCNGGTLSSSNTLNPTFTANNYNYNYTSGYTCTLTVNDARGGSGSDTVYIYTGNNNTNAACGSANGQTFTSMPYYGLCNYGTASSVSGSGPWNWTCYGTNNGNTVSCSAYANQQTANPIISSGGNREVNKGASISLIVTAYDPNGYSLTYNWSCTGGTLSNYNTINPTYYAPMVNSDTNYYCTITVNNNRGGTATANVNILVRDLVVASNVSIATNAATAVKTTSATLNGTLLTDSTNNSNIKFDWGRVNGGFTSSTNAIYNKRAGEYFSDNLNSLEKGKAYQFKATATNSNGTTTSGNIYKFITQPEAPTYFDASISGNRVNLTWTKGEGAFYTTVIRKVGDYPSTVTDGSVVYYGTGNSYTDAVSTGNYYYYRAWSVAYDGGLYAWSDSTYARDYVRYVITTTYTPTYVQPTTIKTVVRQPVVIAEEPVSTCEMIANNALSLEVVGKNITQKKEWSRTVNANPGDEIDIQIKVASLLDKSVNNIMLTNVLPVKTVEVSNILLDGQSFGIDISNGVILGDFNPKESKILSFRIKLAGENVFTEKETNLVNSVDLNGRNIDTIKDSLPINVINTKIAGSFGMASVDIFGGWWLWLLLLGLGLFVLLLIVTLFYLIYLLMKKNREEQDRVSSEKVALERSRYFQIQ